MKTVSRIDPISKQKKKLRVAAYCRVSTDMDAQLESLEAQKNYYESYIGSRADWVLVGIYHDEGITGTKKDKRPDLLRMMEDCEAGKIDFILTKSMPCYRRPSRMNSSTGTGTRVRWICTVCRSTTRQSSAEKTLTLLPFFWNSVR